MPLLARAHLHKWPALHAVLKPSTFTATAVSSTKGGEYAIAFSPQEKNPHPDCDAKRVKAAPMAISKAVCQMLENL